MAKIRHKICPFSDWIQPVTKVRNVHWHYLILSNCIAHTGRGNAACHAALLADHVPITLKRRKSISVATELRRS